MQPPRRNILIVVSLAALLAAGGASAQQGDHPIDASEPAASSPAESGESTDSPGAGAETPAPRSREPVAPPQDERRISLEATLRTWYVSPGGRFLLPGETRGGRNIDLEDLNLDSPRVSPFGEVRFGLDRWSLTFSGAHFRTDRSTDSPVTRRIGDLNIVEGDLLDTELRYTTAELMVGHTFFQRELQAFDDPRSQFGVELEVSLGVRFDHFDIELEQQGGGRLTVNEGFLFPQGGIEARIRPTRRTLLGLAGRAGQDLGLSDQTVTTSDIIVRAAIQPSPWVEVMVGYRITIQRLETDGGVDRFEFKGSHAGLFAGVKIGF